MTIDPATSTASLGHPEPEIEFAPLHFSPALLADGAELDSSFRPPPSKCCLGVDLGSSRVRYSLFSRDDPSSAFSARA
jgi:hypothetical protein